MDEVYAVIMAGGKGERFWPLSAEAHAKPFIRLLGARTLLQQTVDRCRPLVPDSRILVVLGREHLGLAREQLPRLRPEQFVVEPMGRDTAPCIGLAALRVPPEAVMIVLPADHYIPEREKFLETIAGAVEIAAQGPYLVTLGIRPTRPDSNFGYILVGQEAVSAGNLSAYLACRFTEKPDEATAIRYLEEGRYFWNCGIFIWRARTIQEALGAHLPELWHGLEALRSTLGTPAEASALRRLYAPLTPISIDYGVLEKATNILVIPAQFLWDDVGNWSALARLLPADAKGNSVVGNHVGLDTEGCVIYSRRQLVATLGVRDLVIAAAGGRLLVCSKARAKDLKRLLEALREAARGGDPAR